MLQLDKPAALLFATDIAARGLDFPSVDWVLQLDCPENPEAYVHRVGRTARFKADGRSLLVLLPSEVKMVHMLQDSKIPLKRIVINPKLAHACTSKISAEVAADPELKLLAQKAFASYFKSVFVQPIKDVFDVEQLPNQKYAESLGLLKAPKVTVAGASHSGAGVTKTKNLSYAVQSFMKADKSRKSKAKRKSNNSSGSSSDSSSSSGSSSGSSSSSSSGSSDSDSDSDSSGSSSSDDSDEEADGGLLRVKERIALHASVRPRQRPRFLACVVFSPPLLRVSNRQDAAAPGAKAPHGPSRFERYVMARDGTVLKSPDDAGDVSSLAAKRAEAIASRLQQVDAKDKVRDRERIRRMHREERWEARNAAKGYDLSAGLDGDDDGVIDDSDSEPEGAAGDASDGSGDGDGDDSSESDASAPAPPSTAAMEDMALQLLSKRRKL